MPRISQLPSLTAADNADEIAIVDVSSSTTKKITRGDLLKAPLPANSVTTAAIDDGAVTAPKIDFTTLKFGNYSTSEQDTGFKWVDGKNIYKKTINYGALPNSSQKQVVHGITNLDLVVDIIAIAKRTASPFEQISVPLVYDNSAVAYNTTLDITSTHVEMTCSQNRSMFNAYVTLFYTKTA